MSINDVPLLLVIGQLLYIQVLRAVGQQLPFYFYLNNQNAGHNGLVVALDGFSGVNGKLVLPLKVKTICCVCL